METIRDNFRMSETKTHQKNKTSQFRSRIPKFKITLPVRNVITHDAHKSIKNYDYRASLILQVGQSKLFLSSEEFASDKRFLKDNNIGAIVCVMIEQPKLLNDPEVSNINFLHIPINDFLEESISNHFETCNDFINCQIKQNKSVLVHCKMGISRSATIITAYLMKTRNMTLKNALDYVTSKRNYVCPNFGFHLQLHNYEKILNE